MNDNSQKDYDEQIKDYIENHLNLKNYKITYKKKEQSPYFIHYMKRGEIR